MQTPVNLGHILGFSMSILIFWVLEFILNDETDGVISSFLKPLCIKAALKSLATPRWLMASDLFGVKPILKTLSE